MISYTCFQDILEHGRDYLGGGISEASKRDCVRAALEALRDIANAFNWSYFYTHGRVITDAMYDASVTGATIQYQHSGGAYPRQVTISGDTWPTWAAGSYVRTD